MAVKKLIIGSRRDTTKRQFEYLVLDIKRFCFRLFHFGKPIDQKLILFEAYDGGSYACSPKAIYEALLQDHDYNTLHFVWVFRDIKSYQMLKNERTKLVRYRSKEYYKALAMAGTWVVNTRPPLDLPKRKNQLMVQCWHGTPFKRLRTDIVKNTQNALDSYDDIQRKNKLDTIRYNYFISPSQFATEKFSSSFQLDLLHKENIVIETGYPRNDFLRTFQKNDLSDIKKRLKIPAGKKILLYAPTWRDDQFIDEKGFVYKAQIDFNHLKKTLKSEYVVLFRAHYLVANKFNFSQYAGFVYNVSDVDDINELYVISDALITDYSSVFFDYAILKRPIVFYMYDKKHYEEDLRGFYLKFDELPGEIAQTQRQLEHILSDIPEYFERNKEKVAAFSRRYNYLDDGHATERVISKVFSGRI